jgi:hypothetical protein
LLLPSRVAACWFVSTIAMQPVAGQVVDTAPGYTLLARRTVASQFTDTLVLDLHKHGQYRIAV